jgi:hypothetical protein
MDMQMRFARRAAVSNKSKNLADRDLLATEHTDAAPH